MAVRSLILPVCVCNLLTVAIHWLGNIVIPIRVLCNLSLRSLVYINGICQEFA